MKIRLAIQTWAGVRPFCVQFEVLFSLKAGGNELFGSLKRTDGRQNGDEAPVQPVSVNFASRR